MKYLTAFMSEPLVREAYIFAEAAHAAVGQLRPTLSDPNVPYIVHPIEVADIVASVSGATKHQVAAALLHDVLEDTKVKAALLVKLFGLTVAEYVVYLTDYYTPENTPTMNRAKRKELEAVRLSTAPVAVKTIKLADGLSNTPSIAANKPDFMKVYGLEKRRVLEALRGGDAGLWVKLDEMLKSYGY